MVLEILRKWQIGDATIGELRLDGEFECFTLEDVVRVDPDPGTPEHEGKVYGETAIQPGEYDAVLQKPDRKIWSPRNGVDLPEDDGKLLLLLNVPSWTGIFFHALNKADETLGCVGVGRQHAGAAIFESRAALTQLMRKLGAHGGPFRVTVRNAWVSEGSDI